MAIQNIYELTVPPKTPPPPFVLPRRCKRVRPGKTWTVPVAAGPFHPSRAGGHPGLGLDAAAGATAWRRSGALGLQRTMAGGSGGGPPGAAARAEPPGRAAATVASMAGGSAGIGLWCALGRWLVADAVDRSHCTNYIK